MSTVVFLDTSVLLNVLDVPRRNDDRAAVIDKFKALVNKGALLVVPLAAILEVGNHIAQLERGQREHHAKTFSDLLREAVGGTRPYLISGAHWDPEFLRELIDGTTPSRRLTVLAARGVGTGDGSILLEMHRFGRRVDLPSGRRVELWTLDKELEKLAFG